MSQDQVLASIAIAIDKLVIQLQNKSSGVQRLRAVSMHRKMSHCLIGKKFGLALELMVSLNRERPIKFLKKEKQTCVHRITFLRGISKQAKIG
jgi:hypothetical protein